VQPLVKLDFIVNAQKSGREVASVVGVGGRDEKERETFDGTSDLRPYICSAAPGVMPVERASCLVHERDVGCALSPPKTNP
jgi:hypothetical protein